MLSAMPLRGLAKGEVVPLPDPLPGGAEEGVEATSEGGARDGGADPATEGRGKVGVRSTEKGM